MIPDGSTVRHPVNALGDGAVAVLAGAAAVAGSYAVAGSTPAFVAAPAGSVVTTYTPAAVVTWAIQTLGDLGQDLAFTFAVLLTVGLFALGVWLVGRIARRFATPVARPLGAAAVSLGLSIGLTGAVVPALSAGVAAGAVVALSTLEVSREATPISSARRRVLRAGLGAIGIAALAIVGASRRPADQAATDDGDGEMDLEVKPHLDAARDRSLGVEGIEPLVSEGFYQVDINSVDPRPDVDLWSLQVFGAVETELEIDFEALQSRPAEHRFVTLRCVGEALNGKKMDTALWTGVPVTDILEEAGSPDECCVVLRAHDSYDVGFPLEALRDGLIAYRMNGRPLPRGHGHPVRALVPGHWGEVNVKWLTEIEVVDEIVDGYWERRGWHGTGPVNTVAKLHAVNRLDDGRIRVGGHAYAGTRGIERVEVSTDGGRSWADATLSDRLPGAAAAGSGAQPGGTAQDAWRMWEYRYEANRPHEVVVRATDGEGDVQPREDSQPFPSGATGWVSEQVDPSSI